MALDESTTQEAVQRGYLEINEENHRVTYRCGKVASYNYDDPEEKVRAYVFAWLVVRKGYPADRIRTEVPVPRRTPTDFADIVVYSDSAMSEPYLVVEAKQSGCSSTAWAKGIEQGFGNANSFRVTRYLLVDRGTDSLIFDIHGYPPTERRLNMVGPRERLPENYGTVVTFRLAAGTNDDIRPFSARDLETRIRQAHASIWSGGKRDPLVSFDAWSRLLFTKIYDERHTPNGEPRGFQIGVGESISQAAGRIRMRYTDACQEDRTIFSTGAIEIPDEKIVEVVRKMEDVGFTICEIDAIGAAFEHFFGSVFRGELGQYFTRRELVRFICAVMKPLETDFILDPTAGSGGFLLECLLQTWHSMDERYRGQPDSYRRKMDFAISHLYGIEIHSVLSRLCKVNLYVHRDGHTNIEGERSCLDSVFANPNLHPDGSLFALVVGNPPFGDKIRLGDSDRLGHGSLSDFELSRSLSQVKSEVVIIERALQFLKPGGRLGMIVPDGLLNNQGESSLCPAFRRFILKNTVILGIVSLPDHAFRKAGAQNKTSVLFLRKFALDEKAAFDRHYHESLATVGEQQDELAAIRYALASNRYNVFLGEAAEIGYTPSGSYSPKNDLYSQLPSGQIDRDNPHTILGQYAIFNQDPARYTPCRSPSCCAADILGIIDAHPSHRLDPKFHLFNLEPVSQAPPGMAGYSLRQILSPRHDTLDPTDYPDEEFLTLTLHQDGTLTEREEGKGLNPPSWHGVYFTGGSRWYRVHTNDVIISRIDLWKGCISVIPEEYDGAIVTQEYPVLTANPDELDPRYLVLLLRTGYFRRAIRAVTTGHSNRRRTPQDDFMNLKVFLPNLDIQRRLADLANEKQSGILGARIDYEYLLRDLEEVMFGRRNPIELLGGS